MPSHDWGRCGAGKDSPELGARMSLTGTLLVGCSATHVAVFGVMITRAYVLAAQIPADKVGRAAGEEQCKATKSGEDAVSRAPLPGLDEDAKEGIKTIARGVAHSSELRTRRSAAMQSYICTPNFPLCVGKHQAERAPPKLPAEIGVLESCARKQSPCPQTEGSRRQTRADQKLCHPRSSTEDEGLSGLGSLFGRRVCSTLEAQYKLVRGWQRHQPVERQTGSESQSPRVPEFQARQVVVAAGYGKAAKASLGCRLFGDDFIDISHLLAKQSRPLFCSARPQCGLEKNVATPEGPNRGPREG